MTGEELSAWLFSRTTQGIRWGLERTRELLADVDNPHRLFHSILIAGTNGKGSVAAMCDSVLRQNPGLRVGLYTSPHLIHFNERIRVDGRPISDEALSAAAERLKASIDRTGATFFEAATAIAFLAFAEAKVDVLVAEVGLGGRLDATNVLEPLVTAVTSIGLDHTEYLGADLESIAREKAGIFRAGVPAITGVRDPALRDALRGEAEARGAELIETGAPGYDGTPCWGSASTPSALAGVHQAENAAVAAAVLCALPPELRPGLEQLGKGMAEVRWPGRLQKEKVRSTTWLLDVAHNEAGVESLLAGIPELDLPSPHVFLIGILGDKDWRGMIRRIAGAGAPVILTVPPTAPAGRRWNVEEAAEFARSAGIKDVRVIPDFAAAVGRAETMVPHGTVIVSGSVHTVGDAMALLGISAI